MKVYYKATYTYKAYRVLQAQFESFVTTLGKIVGYGLEFLSGLKEFPTTFRLPYYQNNSKLNFKLHK